KARRPFARLRLMPGLLRPPPRFPRGRRLSSVEVRLALSELRRPLGGFGLLVGAGRGCLLRRPCFRPPLPDSLLFSPSSLLGRLLHCVLRFLKVVQLGRQPLRFCALLISRIGAQPLNGRQPCSGHAG